jgi:hypothetical protein
MPRKSSELARAIERLLRDRIRIMAESRRDERVLRIAGFGEAARDLAEIMEHPESPRSMRKSATHG